MNLKLSMIKKFFLLISIQILTFSAYSQVSGIHNFYTHNLFYYNPAHAGDAEGLAAFMSYRNHLTAIPDAPVTGMFGLHAPILKKMSLGGMFMNQTEGLLSNNSVRLDYSYRTKITKDQTISFGINGGYLSKKLNINNVYVFDPQDPVIIDNYNIKPVLYAGAGISYNYKNFEFDIVVPVIYRTSTDSLTRYLSYITYDFFLNKDWSIKPSVMATYVKQEGIGGQVDLNLDYKNVFWVQGAFKKSRSMVFSAGFNISRIGIAYAFETNSSAISYIGGPSHEVLLTYGFGGKKQHVLKDTIPVIVDTLSDNRLKHTVGNKTYEEYIMSNNYAFYNDVLDLTDSMRREEVRKIDSAKVQIKRDSVARVDSIRQHPVQELAKHEYDILKRGVHFEMNSAVLTNNSREYLDSVAVLMEKNTKIKVLITGYTCDLGSKEVNERYSKLRAEAVKYYLESKGVAPERITTDGKADAQPLVPNINEENREQNRRVDFAILRE